MKKRKNKYSIGVLVYALSLSLVGFNCIAIFAYMLSAHYGVYIFDIRIFVVEALVGMITLFFSCNYCFAMENRFNFKCVFSDSFKKYSVIK